METGLLAIGRIARLSGLTVSALRFYDGAGVLTPAVVDERSGYRWYSGAQLEDACLLARLRRVGMPLPDIARVLSSRSQPAGALAILDAHLWRLEAGLTDARREISSARALLEYKETMMTETWTMIAAPDLAAELGAIRFAVSTDPDQPVLAGVLFDVDPKDGVLRLVATDRYRMAVSAVVADGAEGPAVRLTAPAGFVDDAIVLLTAYSGQARLTIGDDRITLEVGGERLGAASLEGEFPDYRRLIPARPAQSVVVDVASLRTEIEATPAPVLTREQDGAPYRLTVLSLDQDGVLSVGGPPAGTGGLAGIGAPAGAGASTGLGVFAGAGAGTGAGTVVGVNREFLLQALNAGDQLLLELDGPITPLALRDPDRDGSFSLLMPTRLP